MFFELVEGFIMVKKMAFAAAAAVAFAASPAMAAHVVYLTPSADTDVDGDGDINLTYAGPGARSSAIAFDVKAAGNFTATFDFFNVFNPAAAGGSATFNFDPDIVTFTSGNISGGGVFTPVFGPTGASIQIDRLNLPTGWQTLSISGTLASAPGGNAYARIGGQLTLTGAEVPEPATWALFILGFGAVGHIMRRRSTKVRVAKASLNFA